MRKTLIAALAFASLSAPAGLATADPEVRPDTLTHVQGPPWASCVRWDRHTHVCRDVGWRGRSWRGWSGRRSCRRGRGWWIDNWGRWRRC